MDVSQKKYVEGEKLEYEILEIVQLLDVLHKALGP